ncbi:MAG: cysteine--tRNA ligase [Dehalococcoidia bacterium]|nr:cysteine--tRNA ligase [Dehalococcoidia bacterium]
MGKEMLKLYNTMTRRKEEFHPLHQGLVGMYSCGPTVYRYAHIGNMRTYLMADWLRRVLEVQGNSVQHVKNITDVGHMRQDLVEQGEDKMIAAALAEGKTLWEIADFYTSAFHSDEEKLGILPASHYPKATQHIEQMLQIIEKLFGKGYAYESEGNVYFDVSKYPDYGALSHNQQEALLAGVRVEVDPLKRSPSDFTLWKAAEPGRMVKWPSPWGEGFPGWHIECSAMSMRYLGEEFDIHTGGVDNIFPHHEGEIAQSEGATGKQVVKYWVHGQHLLADGVKMAKSTGNSYTISDLEARGFSPLSFRYLCLTAHYRSRLNFSFSSLRAAQRGLAKLKTLARHWKLSSNTSSPDTETWRAQFWDVVNDDLNMASALGVVWRMAHSALPDGDKALLVKEFDGILGLQLLTQIAIIEPAQEVVDLTHRRDQHRSLKDYQPADELRHGILAHGFEARDASDGTTLVSLESCGKGDKLKGTVSSPLDVASLLDKPSTCEISVNILASDFMEDVERCLGSLLKWCNGQDMEIVVVDNGSSDTTGAWLYHLSHQDKRVRVIHADHNLGWGAGRNVALKQSLGRHIIMLDTSVEATGDFISATVEALGKIGVGIIGSWGLRSDDMHAFHETGDGEVDAMQGYVMAFPRQLVKEIGLIDEKYRFYRHGDLDYSMAFKSKGYKIVQLSSLPFVRHEHRGWTSLSEEERDRYSKRNYYRFLSKWDDREDLLVKDNQ